MVMKKVNIGIIGLGTIGSGVYKILNERRARIKKLYGIDIKIVRCCDISESSKRKLKISNSQFTKDFRVITRDKNVDVVIELIGGTKVAYKISEDAIKNGKNLITANKALLAERGKDIDKLLSKTGKNINYEASVGGGIPIIGTIRDSILINNILSFQGIMNGTCNYVLSLMSRKIEFQDAIKAAQKAGFAETDSTLDINGKDTAHKVVVLCKTCFGLDVKLKDMFIEGIENITSYDLDCSEKLGYKIKLLGIGRIINNHLDARVHPALVRQDNPLANVDNEFNAILVNSKNLGPFMSYGYGAGMLPTASAVVSDIIRISREDSNIKINQAKRLSMYKIDNLESKFYLRIELQDESGNLGTITSILGQYKISIDKIIQNSGDSKVKGVPVVILTKKNKFHTVNKAINKMKKLKFVGNNPLLLPIEDSI